MSAAPAPGGLRPGDTADVVVRAIGAAEPERVALQTTTETVTYQRLDEATDRLAQRVLDDLGDGPHRVAVCLDDAHALLVASLALTRAGMVAVPLDPAAPASWHQRVLEQAAPALVLTDVDGVAEGLAVPTAHPLRHAADPPAGGVVRPPGEVVSVTFTSGSTGEPKGILIPRAQLPVVAHDAIGAFGEFPPGLRIGVLVAGTVGWVERLMQGAIVLAGTIVAYPVRELGTGPIGPWLARERIFGLLTVPTVIRQALRALPDGQVLPDLRALALHGETTTWEDVAELRRHLAPDALIVNMFGLTETGLVSAMLVTPDLPAGTGPVPIGRPLPGHRILVLGEDGAEVPDGEAGELVVESAAASLGYLGRDELSVTVFAAADGEPGTQRVRTGDLGRRDPDGLLHHLGRGDQQVKVAGNRVELGELETALRGFPGVSAAVATTYADPAGATRLAAFVVPRPGADPDLIAMRAELADRLPAAFVPDGIGLLATLPTLPTGKVDRAGLPVHAHPQRKSTPVPPRTAAEQALLEIWRDVLGRDDIGVEDDFFALSGDSLRAAEVCAEVARVLDRELPVTLFVTAPTIAAFAATLDDHDEAWAAPVAIQPSGRRPPLFVVHDSWGNLFPARRLSLRLGSEQPVFGLQAAALHDGAADSIEAIAAGHAKAIRALRPDGPYRLYGHMAGGTIAFAVALDLQAAGQAVDLLVLDNVDVPGAPPRRRPRTLRGVLRNVVRRPRPAPAGSVPAVAPELPAVLQAEAARVQHVRLAASYVPAARFVGEVFVLRPGGPDAAAWFAGWTAHVTGEVVQADHPTVRSEVGRVVGEDYADALRRAAARTADG